MINRIFMVAAVMLIALTGCQDDRFDVKVPEEVPDGYQSITFKAAISDFDPISTRAVDPDGVDISSLMLFCFNEDGLFITYRRATLTSKTYGEDGYTLEGTYNVAIPAETKIIHFVGNQPEEMYANADIEGKTEDEINASMEGASGMIIYWARFVYDESGTGTLKEQLQSSLSPVRLMRNQARVSFVNDEGSELPVTQSYTKNGVSGSFTVLEFTMADIHAFGTVAPYHPTYGFPTQNSSDAADLSWWKEHGTYVTLPQNTAEMSGISDTNDKLDDYIFEHENTEDNPVCVIIKGYNNSESSSVKYYKAHIIDDNESYIPICRNHWYKLHITGKMEYGYDTFEEALNGTTANNIWASVSSWVNSVSSAKYTLTVEKTSEVFDYVNGATKTYNYTLTDASGNPLSDSDGDGIPDDANGEATITWLGENNLASTTTTTTTYDTSTGKGSVTITVLPMGDDEVYHSGTLLIKKGLLRRTIELGAIKTQTFSPAWVTTQIYSNSATADDKSKYVTCMFTVPENCPDIMFPFNVYVTVDALDVRSSSGQKLPVISDTDSKWDETGAANNYGYKYEFTVTQPGVQRLYFQSVFNQTDADVETLMLQAAHFTTLTKSYRFVDTQYAITVPTDGNMYKYQDPTGANGAKDDYVYYCLVPQKINAPIVFDFELQNAGTATNPTANDEFLFYSQNLDYYLDSELQTVRDLLGNQSLTFDCTFYDAFNSSEFQELWQTSTNGRVMPFKPLSITPSSTGAYSVYMKTNKSVSDEVVRIASNQSGQNSVWSSSTAYSGRNYRSVIFELANYRPYRFAAQVGSGTQAWGTIINDNGASSSSAIEEEVVDNISVTYQPNQQVEISFDVTSYRGTDGKSVDPFGTAFEIYIDAPMLKLDESRLADFNLNSSKIYADPEVEGRFVYVVDASRSNERNYGYGTVENDDTSDANPDQTGERKTIPFVSNSVVSEGTITISSNKDKVVYHDKSFVVTCQPMTGTIQYIPDGSADVANAVNIPSSAFVSFSLQRNGVRIGSLTMTGEGTYQLVLRKEYTFDWDNDKVEVNYIDPNDKTVSYDTLNDLDSNGTAMRDITLASLFGTDGTGGKIILTKAQAVVSE